MHPKEQAAKAIIKMLNGRKGFEYWWHDIDEETKAEIVEEIAATIDDVPN